MPVHFFDSRIAEKVGINCAVILHHLYFWVGKNEANDQHFHDGRYWTYNSVKAFEKQFPYMTTWQRRAALDKLRAEGLIVTGNYNETPYDRTMWYALTDLAYSMFEEPQIDLRNSSNQFATGIKPIPYIKPDNKPNNTTVPQEEEPQMATFKKPTLEEVQKVISDKRYKVDAEAFIAFYDSNGWKVGKNPMKSWKSALVTWHKRHSTDAAEKPPVPKYDRF